MIKRDYVKKKLIAEGIVAAVIVGVAGAVMFGVMAFSVSLSDDQLQKQNRVSGLMVQTNAVTQQMKTASEAIKKYQAIHQKKSESKGDFGLNRKEALAQLDKLSEKYRMVLTAEFDSPQEMTEDRFKKKTAIMTNIRVKLSFKAITDEYVFSFLNALSKELQGNVQFLDLNLSRTGIVSKETLVSIGQGKNPALVDGTVTFNWLGLKEKQADAPPSPGSPGMQPGSPL